MNKIWWKSWIKCFSPLWFNPIRLFRLPLPFTLISSDLKSISVLYCLAIAAAATTTRSTSNSTNIQPRDDRSIYREKLCSINIVVKEAKSARCHSNNLLQKQQPTTDIDLIWTGCDNCLLDFSFSLFYLIEFRLVFYRKAIAVCSRVPHHVYRRRRFVFCFQRQPKRFKNVVCAWLWGVMLIIKLVWQFQCDSQATDWWQRLTGGEMVLFPLLSS